MTRFIGKHAVVTGATSGIGRATALRLRDEGALGLDDPLERHLPGARFVVLNRPGAGAEVGYTALATAAPDGFTLGVVIVPSLQTITIERTPRYRLEDLAYIGSVVDDPGGF